MTDPILTAGYSAVESPLGPGPRLPVRTSRFIGGFVKCVAIVKSYPNDPNNRYSAFRVMVVKM